MVIEHPIEDEVTQLARRVEKARGRLAYQFDPALTEALSEDELHAERELAERIRTQERGQRWKEAQAAAAASDRARQTTEAIEKADMRDLLLARKAIAAQRRESSPHAKLASLYRHRSWSLRALAGVVAAGMLWSAVNVQHNIAPGGATDPLYWFSYLLEGMISVCLIIIMVGTNKVAEWGVVDNRRQVATAEIALLALTVSLNTYPYLRTGAWYDAAVHAIAPVMIGVALLIHDAASSRYGLAIARATEQVRDLPDPAEQIRAALPRYRTPVAPEPARHQPDPEAHIAATAPSTAEGDLVAPLPDERPAASRRERTKAENTPSQPVQAEKGKPAAEPAEAVASKTETMKPEPVESPVAQVDKRVDAPRKPVLPETIEALDAMPAPETSPLVAAPAEDVVVSSGSSAPVFPAEKADLAAPAAKAEEPAVGKAAASKPVSAKPRLVVSDSEAPTVAFPEIAATVTRPLAESKPVAPKVEGKNGKDAAPEVPPIRTPDIYDTGSFRVADILEQELAELQAERRRARTQRQRSASAVGRES